VSEGGEIKKMNSTLFKDLRNLKLSGIAKTLEVRNEQAIREKLSYMEFLELLIEDELAIVKTIATRKDFKKLTFLLQRP